MAMSPEESILRIALLVARADGLEGTAERRLLERVMPVLFLGRGRAELDAIAERARQDVQRMPHDELLVHVCAGLPDRPQRIQALTMACNVAGADRLLSWAETSNLVRLAQALGLSRREVGRVVKATATPL